MKYIIAALTSIAQFLHHIITLIGKYLPEQNSADTIFPSCDEEDT